ncbi:MAG: hypothetical protein KDA69_21570, partial [Planctomycetaceae bacterium]|nr:hypothetical protein [Planctomycetaceae bacterium]
EAEAIMRQFSAENHSPATQLWSVSHQFNEVLCELLLSFAPRLSRQFPPLLVHGCSKIETCAWQTGQHLQRLRRNSTGRTST